MGEMIDGITRVLGSEEENAMDEDIGYGCSYVNFFQDYNVAGNLLPKSPHSEEDWSLSQCSFRKLPASQLQIPRQRVSRPYITR